MDISHFILTENINPNDATNSPGTAEYQRKMANMLNKTKESKILSFKQKAIPAQEGTCSGCVFCYRSHDVCE